MTVTATELATRVEDATGLRLGNGTSAMFLSAWLEAGVVVELSPGRYALTSVGERLASGLLAVDAEERDA